MSYISFKDVCKEYQVGDSVVHASDHVNFEIEKGEFCVILGPSGSGKTTVLNLLGGMDNPTSGEIVVGDKMISKMNRKQLTAYRRDDVGFVFQFYNLIPNLTAKENVELGLQGRRMAIDPQEMLRMVGLEARVNNFPAQMSGGEQQRVSIARALCKQPGLLLCDEPTGALDSKTGEQVLKLLTTLNRETGTTVVVITHNASIALLANRVIRIRSGSVQENSVNANPAQVEDIAW